MFIIIANSCEENPSNTKLNNSFDLRSHLTIKNGGNLFTKTFYDLGAQEVEVKNKNGRTSIDFFAPNATFIGENFLIKSKLSFHIENEVLHLKGEKEYGITLIDGSPYIISPNFNGYLSEMSKKKL